MFRICQWTAQTSETRWSVQWAQSQEEGGEVGEEEQSQRVHDHDDAVQARNDLFTCTLALTTVRVSVRKEDRITR